jgi:hypothetical protein
MTRSLQRSAAAIGPFARRSISAISAASSFAGAWPLAPMA